LWNQVIIDMRYNISKSLLHRLSVQKIKLEQWWKYNRHLACPVNPFEVYWVDPDLIWEKKVSPLKERSLKRRTLSHILDGDWDQQKKKFNETVFFKSMKERFKHNEDWARTPYYKDVINSLRSKSTTGHWGGCKTKRDVDERCKEIGELYREISENGFKTYKQRTGRHPPVPLEIHVMVTRDGEFIRMRGKHRIAIAKLLDIDTVPVNILVRHGNWQKVRDRVYNSGNIQNRDSKILDLSDHSDLRKIRT